MSGRLKKDIVYELLKQAILNHDYSLWSKLPSGVKLAQHLGVSHITLRAVLKRLEKEQLLVQVHGRGTFVTYSGDKDRQRQNFLAILPEEAGSLPVESPNAYIMPACDAYCRKLNVGLKRLELNFIDFAIDNPELLQLKGYDGILILHQDLQMNLPHAAKFFAEQNKPVAVPHAHYRDIDTFPDFALIMPDRKKAFGDGVKHLISQGHRRILTIAAENDFLYKNQMILHDFEEDEYLRFLKQHGADSSPELLLRCRRARKKKCLTDIRAAVLAHKPDAIMCFSDFFAMLVYQVLFKLRIKIPNQIAVMGYSLHAGSDALVPPLSSVDLKHALAGKMAIDALINADQWFNKPGKAPRQICPHAIVPRESTANKTVDRPLTFPQAKNVAKPVGVL